MAEEHETAGLTLNQFLFEQIVVFKGRQYIVQQFLMIRPPADDLILSAGKQQCICIFGKRRTGGICDSDDFSAVGF